MTKYIDGYQWWYSAHIENEEDPYDNGHIEECSCSDIFLNKEIAEQNKPNVCVGSPMGGCYVIDVCLKTIKICSE